MRKEEFLTKLESLLADISEEERAEAMAFYRSYFEDAGIGNEEKILAELESPEKVAEIIKRDLGMICTAETATEKEKKETTGEGFRQQHGEEQYNGPQNGYGSYADSEEAKHVQEKKKNLIPVLIIVLLVLASPVLLGGLAGLFGAVFGMAVSLIAATFALFAAGAVFVGVGIVMLTEISVLPGMAFLGMGFLVLALALLLLSADVWIFGKFVPWVCKGMIRIGKKPFEKRKEAQEA